MKTILNLFKKNKFLFCAVILAAVLRLIWLDRVSPAIGGDELTYIITAKFMALRWSDISGTWNPLSVFLFHYPPGEFQAEISYFLLLPFVKFLPFSLFSVKLVFATLSIATVLVLYFLSEELFEKRTAIAVAFIAAVNPWAIFLGRTAYEMVPETFFYLLAIYVLVKAKGNNIYWAIPFFAFAFYSHIATKIIFFPIVFTVLFYLYFQNKKKFLKQYFVIGFFALLLALLFAITIKLNPDLSRISELINPNDPKIMQMVDSARKATIDSKLNYISTNKVTVLSSILIAKIFRTISPEYLFLNGDQFYSLYTHGFFYVIDAIFIFIGMSYSFIKERKKFLLLFSLSFLSIVPHLLHTLNLDNFVPQIALLFPFLIIFCGYGMAYIYQTYNKKVVLIFMVIIYVFSLLNFLNIYLYQFPLKETFDFKLRVVSRYVKLAGMNQKINIYSNGSADYFSKYLFYTDSINESSADKISASIKKKKYILDNVTFLSCNVPDLARDISIISTDCSSDKKDISHISIARLIDGGATYRIYNDTVCRDVEVGTYAKNVKLSDFSVEKLSREKFCKTFIVKQ